MCSGSQFVEEVMLNKRKKRGNLLDGRKKSVLEKKNGKGESTRGSVIMGGERPIFRQPRCPKGQMR